MAPARRLIGCTVLTHSYSLFADYYQFYLQDEASNGVNPDAWTDDAVVQMVAISPGALGVCTARNTHVPVTVAILDSEPPLETHAWDHIVECALEIRSGVIVVAGSSDFFPDAARVSVAPGTYRVRVSIGGLDTISADGQSGGDSYRLQLWQAIAVPPRVLKRSDQKS
jgi:hypothetical protein